MFPTYDVIFYFFSAALILASIFVVISCNPVNSILFLILAFFCSSVLWLLLQAEFLALVLIFVYVGAVMTLFMFVLMMVNFDSMSTTSGRLRLMPVGLVVLLLLLGVIGLTLIQSHLPMMSALPHDFGSTYNNTQSLGVLLFTQYIYPFEIAGVILLVAMVAAISLTFFGRRHDVKVQKLAEQHEVTKASRLKLVEMKGEGS